MIQVDVPIAFAIGGALASAAHRQIETRDVNEFRLVLLKTNYYKQLMATWSGWRVPTERCLQLSTERFRGLSHSASLMPCFTQLVHSRR